MKNRKEFIFYELCHHNIVFDEYVRETTGNPYIKIMAKNLPDAIELFLKIHTNFYQSWKIKEN